LNFRRVDNVQTKSIQHLKLLTLILKKKKQVIALKEK
jgi:hypothetical protein